MIDAALIERCADPSLSVEIVEQFVSAAGSDDPLAITIKSGGRLVLIPKPKTPDELLEIMRQHVGHASVRVGITQYPAGVGIKDIADLDPKLADPCENLKLGTALFAKVARIVTKWYGSPTSKDVLPQMFDDALYAWRTGEFEGAKVFQADDPGGATFLFAKDLLTAEKEGDDALGHQQTVTPETAARPPVSDADAGSADMRIDLSRIGGK
ncbi:conjugal transfer protein TraH [Agrobacterium tumefaciens]|nr:conjugal transfer protein TraH [Agrobacterium tumefaciens]